MNKRELAEKIKSLNDETVIKLERWFVLFERQLVKAEEKDKPIDLKEIINFTKSLDAIVDVQHAVEKYLGGGDEHDDEEEPVDTDAIRKFLSRED
ncbi:MAG: hypothetical protein ABI579_09825 [Candidatus Sumerlaeota bacterium]